MSLIAAVKENDVAALGRLIGGGEDLDSVDEEGRTALYWAADDEEGHACMRLLLGAKANVDKACHMLNTPLHRGANNGDAECVAV